MKTNTSKEIFSLSNIWLSLIYLVGIGIAVYQWLFNRSFWLDEAMLANNIISRNFIELLKPLDHFTAAPPLYLWSVKLITLLTGNSEYSFRFFALACFVLAGICFFFYLKKCNKGIVYTVFAFSLFMFNAFYIRYASELKQYMTDVLFSTLFLLLTQFYLQSKKNKKYLNLLLVTGCLGILYSHAVIILIATSIALFCYHFLVEKKIARNEIGVILFWLVSILVVYLLFFANHPSKQFQINYWIDAGAFLPIWGSFSDILVFASSKIKMVFFELFPFGQSMYYCLMLLFIIGFLHIIYKKNWQQLILLTSPIVIHLTLSALKMYPFEKRYLIYLIPFVILMIGEGFQILLNFGTFNKYPKLLIGFSLLITLILLKKTFENKFPIKIEEVKEVINYFKKNEQKGDNLYVYYSTKPAFDYYLKTNYFNTYNPIYYGTNQRDSIENYISQFPKVKGKIWVMLSHIHKQEDKYILNNLKQFGYKEITQIKVKGAALFYYESPY